MSYNLIRTENELLIGKFSLFPNDLVIHAISTRLGGISQNFFKTLNLALHVGDRRENVLVNRKIFMNTLNFGITDIVTSNQIHGEKIFRVDERYRGCGCSNYSDSISETDALITNSPSLPLMLCFADCVPVFFIDPINSAIGLAHSGWRGTLKKIAIKTLKAMNKEFGTEAEKCLIGIGPSIGFCCYEVDENIAQKYQKEFSKNFSEIFRKRNGKIFLNLWQTIIIQLLEIGVSRENIDLAEECTCCKNDLYFSHRAALKKELDRTGRIAAVIALKKQPRINKSDSLF